MQHETIVNGVKVTIDLPGVTETAFIAVADLLNRELKRPEVKNRDAIKEAYLQALRSCPTANASDLWHHVVYRQYCEIVPEYKQQNPNQSWVRASGEALELALQEWYSPVLSRHGIILSALLGKPQRLAALRGMGIQDSVGADKLDMSLHLDDGQLFGGVHVKASLAERVSDDVPCSRAMMNKGYFSPLWTLDVKSFPPPQGDLVNRGELGSPDRPSVKRSYIEFHGDFDNLYSANSRTVPSRARTSSSKRVFTINVNDQPDHFAKEVIARARLKRKKGRAANPPPTRR